MRFHNYLKEVFMSKSLKTDLDKSRKKSLNKFAIQVDGFTEEEAKTIKRANTLRSKWIKFYMKNNNVSKPEAEKAVKVVKL